MPSDDGERKEGRLARHRRIAREIYAEPRSITGHIRRALIAAWASRGAGFYGLGWIFTFIAMEVNMIAGEVAQSGSIGEFLGSQLLEYLLRIGFMSFLNSLLALLWPAYVLQWAGAFWGFALLVGGYLIFEYGIRPTVEAVLPELKAARRKAQKDGDEIDKDARG